MDTAASADSSVQAIGNQAYAIPIDTALSVAHKIIAGQASSIIHIGATGFLGRASRLRRTRGPAASGAARRRSSGRWSPRCSNSAAGQAGVVAGDTIVSLDGSGQIAADLSNLLEPKHPGDRVRLQWTDQSGQPSTTSVTRWAGSTVKALGRAAGVRT